jgi:hypothetical protein
LHNGCGFPHIASDKKRRQYRVSQFVPLRGEGTACAKAAAWKREKRPIGHFIGGKRVEGKSGRFADVYNPSTGEVQAKVALATQDEVRAAVENAAAAQPKWAAENPQKRARVMMKFIELLHRDMDKLAEMLSRSTARPFLTAKATSARSRSRRVLHRHPHLMKGEYTERRRTRHRHVLDAPAAWRRCRHHAVQLPGDDPDVEVLPGDCLPATPSS